jgi:plasmid stability protein
MISSAEAEASILAQFVVRNLENAVKNRLQRRAKRHGRSMEEEVREILRNAANQEEAPSGGLGTELAALFAKTGLTTEIAELRGHNIKPPSFEP